MATAAARYNFFTTSQLMAEMGLQDLFVIDEAGNPGGWLWQQILSGVDSGPEMRNAIELTDVWRDEFGVIVEQRRRRAAGDPVAIWTPEEIISYRKTVRQLAQRFNLPAGFLSSKEDIDNLILLDMSPNEVTERISGAFNAVANAPAFVLETFQDFYGIGQGEAALAAWFLDPDRTELELDRQALAAYAGGIAREFDLELDRGRAELFADLGFTDRGVSEALSQINTLSPVLREGFTEVDDLTAAEGFDAVVRGSGDAQSRLERRIISRRAVDQSSQGGALLTQEGLTGAGTAR